MSGTEQRRFSRASTQMQVQLTDSSGREISARLQDVSLGGVYVVCANTFAEQEPCRLHLRLCEEAVIEAEGRVARVTEDGMAITLDGLGVEDYQHLKRLVLFNSPDPEQVLKESEASLGIKPRPA